MALRLSISTLGTRGDVQPFLALAKALIERSHTVQLVAPEQFGDFVKQQGVHFVGLPAGFLDLLDKPEGKAAIAKGGGFSAGLKLLKYMGPLMETTLNLEWMAAKEFSPDVIVYHPKSLASPHIAEKLQIASVLASPLPGFTPTSAFPTPLMPIRTLGPLNRTSHRLAIDGGAFLFRRLLSRWRSSSLGLSRGGRGRLPACTLYAYSQSVLPKPPDWGSDVCVTGYWFLEEGDQWIFPQGLAEFIAAGEKPVYVGFGSMPDVDQGVLAGKIADALKQCGRRGVFAAGGGALRGAPGVPHVHVLDSAPHSRLLPLMSAALHHGGAGTTGASLRAGLPTITCPFFADQPFWGRRVYQLGAGPPPLDRHNLSVGDLVAAINAAFNPRVQRRASEIAQEIQKEHGVEIAVSVLEGLVSSKPV